MRTQSFRQLLAMFRSKPSSRRGSSLSASAGIWLLGVVLLLGAAAGRAEAQGDQAAGGGANDESVPAQIVFRDVQVVPMDTPRVLSGQTVVVRDGRIVLIGPQDLVSVPADAMVIEGRGRYLMPGLSDMHVYYAAAMNAGAARNERMLTLLLANGVTMTREMSGGLSILDMRNGIEEGRHDGPHILVGGPVLFGPPPQDDDGSPGPVRTRDDAVLAVLAQRDVGYQFVGVADNLRADVYLGVIDTADENGLRVCGRIPDEVTVFSALRSGQSTIDFFDNVAEAVESADSPVRGAASPLDRLRAVEHSDPRRIEELLELAQRSRTVWVPTLALNTHRWGVADAETEAQLLQRDGVRAMDPMIPPNWARWGDNVRQAMRDQQFVPPDVAAFAYRLTRLMHARGVPMMLGTASPQMFCIPGESVHEELELLVTRAGLSPFEAIRMATADAAAWTGDERWTGTIEVGRRADLVLVEENPLADIRNTRGVVGVMVGGLSVAPGIERARWYDAEALRSRLQDFARTAPVAPMSPDQMLP